MDAAASVPVRAPVRSSTRWVPRPVGHGEHRGRAVRVRRGRVHIEECTQNGSRAPAYLGSRADDPTTPRPAGVRADVPWAGPAVRDLATPRRGEITRSAQASGLTAT